MIVQQKTIFKGRVEKQQRNIVKLTIAMSRTPGIDQVGKNGIILTFCDVATVH